MTKIFQIITEVGLHARPATRLVFLANTFQADISISAKENTYNMKSIMNVLALGIHQDVIIEIEADGIDADEAMKSITDFLVNEGIAKEINAPKKD